MRVLFRCLTSCLKKTPSAIVVTMAIRHQLASFILLLISKTGFSAGISVFVQMGDSVQLDLQTQELPAEFDDLSWMNEKSENIVKYITAYKKARLHPSYNDRVDFNAQSFSLTLKNTQKNDSGVYRARATGLENKDIVIYRVSVIDAVEAPVLTVNSVWSIGDSCTVNFTCRAHELTINSSYQSNRCSPQEVTSHQIDTLIFYYSEESIICNYSNPVSWKEDRKNITHLCGENVERRQIVTSSNIAVLLIEFGVVTLIASACLMLYCFCKNQKGVKQHDYSDYDDVETLIQSMAGESWTTVTYSTVGPNQNTFICS